MEYVDKKIVELLIEDQYMQLHPEEYKAYTDIDELFADLHSDDEVIIGERLQNAFDKADEIMNDPEKRKRYSAVEEMIADILSEDDTQE